MTSLLSIDVGFDPRADRTLIRLDQGEWRDEIQYHPDPNHCLTTDIVRPHPQPIPSPVHAAEVLAVAGYGVVIGRTPNGRDLQCTPRDWSPAGDVTPGEWTGPTWAVQARRDNYWVVGPHVTEVLRRAGWSLDEIDWGGADDAAS